MIHVLEAPLHHDRRAVVVEALAPHCGEDLVEGGQVDFSPWQLLDLDVGPQEAVADAAHVVGGLDAQEAELEGVRARVVVAVEVGR